MTLPAPARRRPPRVAMPWRAGLVFVAVTAALIAIPSLARSPFGVAPDEYHRGAHAVQALLTTLVVGAIVVLACRWLDRRPLAARGVTGRGAGRMAVVGAAAWLLPAVLAIAGCVAIGWVRVDLVFSPAELLPLVATQALLVLLLEALPEEFAFRGYLFANLSERLGPWATVLTQAALFATCGVLIGAVQDPTRLLIFLGFGIGLGYLRLLTGTIWAGVGLHVAFQTVAQLLGGTQVPAFSVTGLGVLEVVAYGLVPFGLGLPLVARLLRSRPAWLPTSGAVPSP
ncbi:CPBP family intramembrane glutamic endopeptidase [Micromonospora sp. WMMD812]|uniref:CPBP family intramembrane glutamic endopeptidase n=1 Tax=Micromonospora sp. WMMD812 TaxID=3015152 RepID=UPI00248B2A36|nr:CPBP family intramembrane glutamic endopeptidase [Micromonospora sp. WMMD812]WBB69438.1 CPBP family intramembrane metalloprotease [Micromonospora sp. WMMD812]